MASVAELRRKLRFRRRRKRRAERQLVKARRERLHPRGHLVRRVRHWQGLVGAARTVYQRRAKRSLKDPRQEAVSAALAQVGTSEQPAGSNRGPKITTWQKYFGEWLVGQAWCGTFVGYFAKIAGNVGQINSRVAGVALIEDDARAGRNGFRRWSADPRSAKPGDFVVLFGRGVHVGMVVKVQNGYLDTVEGNTSRPGSSGSQSNGGGVWRPKRSFSVVRGIAVVDYEES